MCILLPITNSFYSYFIVDSLMCGKRERERANKRNNTTTTTTIVYFLRLFHISFHSLLHTQHFNVFSCLLYFFLFFFRSVSLKFLTNENFLPSHIFFFIFLFFSRRATYKHTDSLSHKLIAQIPTRAVVSFMRLRAFLLLLLLRSSGDWEAKWKNNETLVLFLFWPCKRAERLDPPKIIFIF